MYKDIINYKLANGISEEYLLEVAKKIITSWMSKQAGFIQWDIHKNADDNTYTDIVFWKSKQDAKVAEKNMANIPNASEWFACYKQGSINSQHLNQIGSFK